MTRVEGSMRIRTLFFASVFICLCSSLWGVVYAEEPIPIGVVTSLTGVHSVYGIEIKRGLELALEEINAQGGVKGRPLRLIIQDDGSDPSRAGKMTRTLIEKEHVPALIGGAVSDIALAIASVCQREKTVFMTPFSTNPAITKIGNFIFRISFNDMSQAEVMARFAYEQLKLTKTVVMKNTSNSYSTTLAEAFKREFTKLGGTVLNVFEYDETTVDFRPLIEPLKKIEGKFGLYLPGYDIDTVRVLKTLVRMNLKPILLGGDTWDSKKLLDIAGTDFYNGYYTTLYDWSLDTEKNKVFVSSYKEKYGATPSPDAEAAYDALHILAAAMNMAPSLNSDAIRRTLPAVQYEGPSGKITLNPDGEANRDVLVMHIQNGKRRLHTLFGAH